MKRIFITAGICVLILLFLFGFVLEPRDQQSLPTGQAGFAVIELFTSEGCSSCPPADDAVAEIQKEYADKNVVVLGYHVDYWDRLGWKDPFSSVDFTSRQKYYAGIFNLNSIYTPEAIVNGKEEFVGSDKTKLTNTVEEQLKENVSATIKLKANQNASGKIEVTYSTEGSIPKQDQLIISLVQKTATNKIRRGENEGRTLHHINIVRELSEMPAQAKEQTTAFNLPPGLKKEDVFIASFMQNKKTGKINCLAKSNIE